MNYNFSTASTLYHGINPGDTNAEKSALDEMLAASAQNDPNVVEGRITYVSPVSTFLYANQKQGKVQHFTLTDIIAKENQQPTYTYRVVAWNEQVVNRLLKIDGYYRLSNFAWKQSSFAQLPEHQSRYEIHLKKSAIIEDIPV